MRYLTLAAFLLLAACGQSGDLYLPAERPEPQPAATPAAPAAQPADEKDDKDKK